MARSAALLLLLLGACRAASSLSPRASVAGRSLAASLRLHGGLWGLDSAVDEDEDVDVEEDVVDVAADDSSSSADATADGEAGLFPSGEEVGALTEEQIMSKLNEVPAFVLMGAGGGFVPLGLKTEGGGRAICFFLEPEEAKAVLAMTKEKDPTGDFKLACVGLGNALKICADGEAKAGFQDFDGHLRVQGPSRLCEEMAPKLKAMLEKVGMGEGSPWQLPVFVCDQIVGKDMLPVFFNPREIKTAWLSNDRKEEDLPNKYVMVDVRMMMADMRKPGSPWSKVQFVGPEGGAELANSLLSIAEEVTKEKEKAA